MSAITVGSVQVDILPDTSEFASRLRAALVDLPKIELDVVADTTAARAAIDELSRNRDSRVDVNVDDALAAARLDELARDRTAEIHVRTDSSGLGGLGGIGGLFSGGGGGLGLAALAGFPLIGPLGAAGIGGLAGVGTAAAAGAAGIGVLALGLSGVKNAVDAVTKAQQGAGAAGVASALAQANAAAAVKAAENGLANAVAGAAYSQTVAEQTLQNAQQGALQAQQALTAARAQAKQQIEDLTLAVEDGALAQRQANLNLIKARNQLELVLSSPAVSDLQRAQAQLNYDQAVQQVKDLGVRQKRLQQQKRDAVKEGVNGSKQVVTAEQAVAKALEQVRMAQLAQANSARQGAASIASAQLSLQNAQRSAAAASAGASAASRAAALDLAALSPAARQFATFVVGTIQPALGKLKAAAATALLPGIQAGFTALAPVLPQVTALVSSLAKVMGELFTEAGKLLASPFFSQFFKSLTASLGPALRDVGQIFLNLLTTVAGVFQAFLPLTLRMGQGVVGFTKHLADAATHLGSNAAFHRFLDYIRDVGPEVLQTIGHLFEIGGKIVVALAPLGEVMLRAYEGVSKFVAALPAPVLSAITGAIVGFVAGFSPLGAALSAVACGAASTHQGLKAIKEVIDKLRPAVEDLWQHALKGLHDAFDLVKHAVGGNRGQLKELGGTMLDVVRIVSKILGPVITETFRNIGRIISGAIIAIGVVVRTTDAVVGFFQNLPGRITKATRGMWDGIKTGFVAVINDVIAVWDKFVSQLKIGGFSTPFGSFGGIDVGKDLHIAPIRLAAGGIAALPTLAQIGEAGPEAVLPLNARTFAALGSAIARSMAPIRSAAGASHNAYSTSHATQVNNITVTSAPGERAEQSIPRALRAERFLTAIR